MTTGPTGISTGITAQQVNKQLKHINAQTTSAAQGKAFEALADYLFSSLGCHTQRDITSPFNSEQIDLLGAHTGFLAPLPSTFIVECKYWEKKVDSKAVGYFVNICRNRGVRLAIVFAKNGLTGDKAAMTAAHSVAFGALPELHLIVVTETDIKGFQGNDDFVNMLIKAWLRAKGGAGVGLTP